VNHREIFPFDYSTRNVGDRYPEDFINKLKFALFLHFTKSEIDTDIDQQIWGEIFAHITNARWCITRSDLENLLLENTAWSVKVIRTNCPAKSSLVGISYLRPEPHKFFSMHEIVQANPNLTGQMVINIWNERVTAVMAKYDHLRTVVLMKSDDLLELAAFETDTVRYDAARYDWTWNQNKNLVGLDRATGLKRFTWQPSGSQFTINEEVPRNRVALRLKQPPPLDRDQVLETIQFSESWVEILP